MPQMKNKISTREGATKAKFAVQFATEINSHDINRNQLKTEMEIATEISQRWRERKRESEMKYGGNT